MMAMLRIVPLCITFHHIRGVLATKRHKRHKNWSFVPFVPLCRYFSFSSMLEPRVLATGMHAFWGLLSETFNEWMEDKAPRLGAALSYYAAFSIAPLFLLLVASVGFIFKGDTLLQVEDQIAAIAGDNAAEAMAAIIRGVKSSPGGGRATILSVITLFLGATGMFGQLQDAMNTIWEVTPKPRRFWMDI